MTFAALVLVVGSAFQTAPATKVDLECRFTRVPLMLEQFQKWVGPDVQVQIHKDFENTPVFISVKQREGRALMEDIAKAVSGEWVLANGTLMLTRSKKFEQEVIADDSVRIEKQIKKSLDEGLKDAGGLASVFQGGEIEEIGIPSSESVPAPNFSKVLGKHSLAFARLLNPKSIAAIQPGTRVVYSSSPNARQQALGGTKNLIVAANRELATEAVSFRKDHPGQELGTGIGADQAVSVVQVAVKRSTPYVYSIEVLLIGAKGAPSRSDYHLDLSATPDDEHKLPEVQKADAKLEKDADSELLQQAFSMFSGPESLQNVDTQKIRALFLHPEKRDPVNLGYYSLIKAYAKDQGKDVVACVSDHIPSFMMGAIGGMVEGVPANQSPSLGEALSRLTKEIPHRAVSHDGTLIIQPAVPSLAWQSRFNRVSFAKIAAEEQRGLGLGINALATFAETFPDFNPELVGIYGMFAAPSLGMVFSSPDYETLRLYGSLTPGQSQAANRGELIGWRTLSPSQRNLFEVAFADTGRSGQFFSSLGNSRNEDEQPGWVVGENAVLLEITDATGASFSNLINLQIRSRLDPIVKLMDLAKFPMSLPGLSAKDYADFMVSFEDPGAAGMASIFPKPEPLRLGQRDIVTLTAFLMPDVTVRRGISTDHFGEQALKFSELPAQFRAEVEKIKRSRTEIPVPVESPGH